MLDKGLAQKLFTARYNRQLEEVARKNAYLNEYSDPENLKHDMVINVWLKAVNAFDDQRQTYAPGDTERAFNAFFTNILNQYLANLSARRGTGKQTYLREKGRSLDAPVKGTEDTTLLDLINIAEEAETDAATGLDLSKMIASLPENLKQPLVYIIEHADPGEFSTVMDEVRDKFGWTKSRLFNALMEHPTFVQFVTDY